eukprot:scaffold35069_cov45-Phaeocystis_antarctica.AAC.1
MTRALVPSPGTPREHTIVHLEMRPTVHAPTAWHSSERSENGCALLYTPVSELGRLWAFKGDNRS